MGCHIPKENTEDYENWAHDLKGFISSTTAIDAMQPSSLKVTFLDIILEEGNQSAQNTREDRGWGCQENCESRGELKRMLVAGDFL